MARMILMTTVGAALVAGKLRQSLATPWFYAFFVAVCALNLGAVIAAAFVPDADLMQLANAAAALVAAAVSFDLNCRTAWVL